MQQPQDLEKYFENSKAWYQQKYLNPLSHRSYAFCVAVVFLFLVIVMIFQAYQLFPIETELKYAVTFKGSASDKKISINFDRKHNENPLYSIAQILIKNYVIQREKYNYADLEKQLLFVKTNSTKTLFNQYYGLISINNPLSPVLRYQDQLTRSIEILDINFDLAQADVKFRSIARDVNNKIQEQMLWSTKINFAISPIILGQATGAPFNFVVTSYELKLLKNETQ